MGRGLLSASTPPERATSPPSSGGSRGSPRSWTSRHHHHPPETPGRPRRHQPRRHADPFHFQPRPPPARHLPRAGSRDRTGRAGRAECQEALPRGRAVRDRLPRRARCALPPRGHGLRPEPRQPGPGPPPRKFGKDDCHPVGIGSDRCFRILRGPDESGPHQREPWGVGGCLAPLFSGEPTAAGRPPLLPGGSVGSTGGWERGRWVTGARYADSPHRGDPRQSPVGVPG